MPRIGFIGTENSHTDHFLRLLNTERRHPGFTGTALVGGRTDRNLWLAEVGGIEHIVSNPHELIGKVDAVIISSRDGATHLAEAEPLLAAGIPLMVDKPLATTVADADALLRAADASHTLLYSASALRFVPQIAKLKQLGAQAGPLRHLHVSGPADPESPYSGLFFYGIHHVEAVHELLGDPRVDALDSPPIVSRNGDTTVALFEVDGVTVTLTFVVPGAEARTPFHVTAVHANGAISQELILDNDYNAPALKNFIDAISLNRQPASRDTMRSPIVILAAITTALRSGVEQ